VWVVGDRVVGGLLEDDFGGLWGMLLVSVWREGGKRGGRYLDGVVIAEGELQAVCFAGVEWVRVHDADVAVPVL